VVAGEAAAALIAVFPPLEWMREEEIRCNGGRALQAGWGAGCASASSVGENELVAGFDVELADLAGGELEDAVGFEADGGEAPGAEALPGVEDAQVLVQSDDVDSEAHPHGVDAGGGANKEAGTVVEGGFSEKAEQSRKPGVSESDAGADGYGLLRYGDS